MTILPPAIKESGPDLWLVGPVWSVGAVQIGVAGHVQ